MPAIETPDETLPVEWRPREDLLPNDWNPNEMSDEKREELIQSILDNGWTQPIVVRAGSDDIIDGEQRWHASGDARIRSNEELTPEGVPAGHVPVFEMEADDTQARVATMQHNVNGTTDSESLGKIFADLDDEGLFYEASERFTIGETGIDRLIERAESDDEADDVWTDEPDADTPDGAFTEALEFQMTMVQADAVEEVRSVVDIPTLCAWAIANNVHSQTRVDMRRLADRDAEWDPAEDPIEYPSVDVEQHLDKYLRDDDPEEVQDE